MTFTYVTLFPELIKGYFSASILSRACEKKLLRIKYANPRDFTNDKHLKVDDYMVGGGAGLLMRTQPLDALFSSLKDDVHIIFTSPAGKKFTQNDAKRLADKKEIVFVCGRYEGIDERVIEKWADEVFCIGDFILTGGEIASLAMSDAISRNVKGVLGNENSLDVESFEDGVLEAPSFTKPNVFEKNSVPLEFLKGNHAKIISLKNKMAFYKTQFFRPDLFKRVKKRIIDEK